MLLGEVMYETVECILALARPGTPFEAALDALSPAVIAHTAHILLGRELERRRRISVASFMKTAGHGPY